MDYDCALSSAWGVASSLTAIDDYRNLDANELRNAIWGVANLIQAARKNIDETISKDVEQMARELVQQRAAANRTARNEKPHTAVTAQG